MEFIFPQHLQHFKAYTLHVHVVSDSALYMYFPIALYTSSVSQKTDLQDFRLFVDAHRSVH